MIVYEPFYSSGQLLSDVAFTGIEVSNDLSSWREFAILVELYNRGIHRRAGLTGLFSPKFFQKSGMRGEVFIEFAESQTEANVVLINAQPQNALMAYNVWQNGEGSHPGLLSKSQALLDEVGISWDLATQARHGTDILCYSNFWVADHRFWDAYVGEILAPLARFIVDHPDAAVVRAMFEPTRHTSPSVFLPFMVERLFTTFLSLHSEWHVVPFLLDPAKHCLSPIESTIIEFTAPIIAAESNDVFSDATIDLLRFAQVVRREYHDVYFVSREHPHTGAIIEDYWHGQR